MVKIRVADYIAKFIETRLEVDKVFLITGGGNMHLTDGILKNKNITHICNHHEQACAMAAVGYAKQTGKPGVVMPTTGCAGTNTITGLLDAWQDSLPCFFISGQVNTAQTCRKSPAKLRKFGVQEVDIIEVVKPLTKYAEMVENPEDIRYHLEKAFSIATGGRPGPVWIDVPLDVQGRLVEEESLKGFTPLTPLYKTPLNFNLDFLKDSKRPIILAGNGIRLSGAEKIFREFTRELNIPVVSTYLGVDLLDGDDTLFTGRVGVKGDRAGNFAMQNADLILAIGTSLSVPVTGYNYTTFGREAKLVVVDVDPDEHMKDTVSIDKFIKADAGDFLSYILDNISDDFKGETDWRDQCETWKTAWSLDPDVKDQSTVDLYHFTKCLSKALPENSSVIGDAGSAFYVPSQALKLKEGQKWITSGAQAEMGFTLPAAIGAQIGSPETTVAAITGDGSFQFNIQELQTIKHYNLPIKLFVWNNNGYLSIRKTQEKFFDGDYIGTSLDSGISFPNLEKIAYAYDIPYLLIKNNGECEEGIRKCLEGVGPIICEVTCDENQKILPTLSSQKQPDGTIIGRPLEDMDPLLPRDEFYRNMRIKPIS